MPEYVLNIRTSITVGPFEAHAGASWVSVEGTRCAADVPSHDSPAAPTLPFLFLCSAPSCTNAWVTEQADMGRRWLANVSHNKDVHHMHY